MSYIALLKNNNYVDWTISIRLVFKLVSKKRDMFKHDICWHNNDDGFMLTNIWKSVNEDPNFFDALQLHRLASYFLVWIASFYSYELLGEDWKQWICFHIKAVIILTAY